MKAWYRLPYGGSPGHISWELMGGVHSLEHRVLVLRVDDHERLELVALLGVHVVEDAREHGLDPLGARGVLRCPRPCSARGGTPRRPMSR